MHGHEASYPCRESDRTMAESHISFRKLAEADLPLMHRWRNAPHVSKWWGITERSPSMHDIRRKYLPRITGEYPVECYLILFDASPVGMVQTYLLDNHPSVRADYKVSDKAAGIDIFIGEKDYVYHGHGSNIIKSFLREIVFKNYDVDRCIIDPEPGNTAAIRAYEKAGFKYVGTIRNQKGGVDAYLMSIDRRDATGVEK